MPHSLLSTVLRTAAVTWYTRRMAAVSFPPTGDWPLSRWQMMASAVISVEAAYLAVFSTLSFKRNALIHNKSFKHKWWAFSEIYHSPWKTTILEIRKSESAAGTCLPLGEVRKCFSYLYAESQNWLADTESSPAQKTRIALKCYVTSCKVAAYLT